MFSLRKIKEKIIVSPSSILMENPHHEWIREDKSLFRFFKAINDLLSEEDFKALNSTKELCYLYSPGRYASTLPSSNKYNFIIVYPELIRLIKSVDNTLAFAIVFHELGHLINEHHKSAKSALEKQIEADNFAIKYGMIAELKSFLLNQNRTFEVVKRLQNLQELEEIQNLDQ